MRLPKAVLWDMDGTLVDTEPAWVAAEYALAEKYGGRWTQEHSRNLVGNDLLDAGRYIRKHMGIDLDPAEIVEALLDDVVAEVQRQVTWREGARELLGDLVDRGVPCALVTMSYQRVVDPILAVLGNNAFDVVVTGDMVTNGKPHPAPYLQAAADLGVAAEDCLAIEDSEPGASSAVAAGCWVLVVPNQVPVDHGERRILRSSLRGLASADLPELFAAVRTGS